MVEFYLFVGITRGLFQKLGLTEVENFGALFPQVDRNANYFPVLFHPKDSPDDVCKVSLTQKEVDANDIRDNTIVELSYDVKKQTWKFLRTREDKTLKYQKYQGTYGNAWKTAENNWNAVIKPVTESIIRGKKKVPFFTEDSSSKSNIWAMRKFHNWIKTQEYAKYTKGIDWLLEIAAGRFADLGRWSRNDVTNVVAMDIDPDALQTGLERYADLKRNHKKGVHVPKIETFVGNAGEEIKVKPGKFDVVSCQFALHFFVKDETTLNKFIANVELALKPGGYFMASTMDGQAVIDLLNANGIAKGQTLDLSKEVYVKGEGSVMKPVFNIRKICDCSKLDDTGQAVFYLC